MIKTCIVGASGYTGAELASLIHCHPRFELNALYVSAKSQDADKKLGDVHGYLFGQINLPLTPLTDDALHSLANEMDVIFLATPHEASHDWMPVLSSGKAKVFDLSGAFRLKDQQVFADYYGFAHEQTTSLEQAVYGLADWFADDIKDADIVAVPGCYPTASLSALKPLHEAGLIADSHLPIINAVSGVSGAGRKAAMGNSFCEVSLQAYGVLGHRHQPEISAYLGREVIFTPHLGNFKRGILATITVKVNTDVSAEDVANAFNQAYQEHPIVRIRDTWPKLDDVVGTPHCDLFWKLDVNKGYLVVTSAIDNLLKGAASQAVQCANIRFGFASQLGLVHGVSA
ncbi:N-acetyl-gamma-glutamyl-phosphate reductase [Paraglaciecola chathamensis]|uniref:N-acetyl-gamma-glutamyl-phosphate reductase n=1 Tax=Paraglaciecola chathamensis TaxID=368405 RepID=UPI00270760BF|nr:N-acetyl-gamma-glutamyl-phosphate reductase [Paraglaciecola chathamensis]MDO6560797.1 N-acetyl-gamma-glutamyl-phosphate reductase [Paraglaciecola chathamensis]